MNENELFFKEEGGLGKRRGATVLIMLAVNVS